MSAPIKGRLSFYSETGTEGGWWGVQDEQFINEDYWDREGLTLLEDGDMLTIYDKEDPRLIVWAGKVKLKKFPVFTEQALGFWIHNEQEGVERDLWAKWFMESYPAELQCFVE